MTMTEPRNSDRLRSVPKVPELGLTSTSVKSGMAAGAIPQSSGVEQGSAEAGTISVKTSMKSIEMVMNSLYTLLVGSDDT